MTQLEIEFDRDPIVVRSVVIAPRGAMQKTANLQKSIEASLGRPVRLDVDQVMLEAGAGALDAQREELRQAGDQSSLEAQRLTALARMIALITGVAADDVTIDRDHRRATAAAVPLPGATLATYRTLEARAAAETDGWSVADRAAARAVAGNRVRRRCRYARPGRAQRGADFGLGGAAVERAGRWRCRGCRKAMRRRRPNLTQRRAQAVAAVLATRGIGAAPAPPAGQRFALSIGATP